MKTQHVQMLHLKIIVVFICLFLYQTACSEEPFEPDIKGVLEGLDASMITMEVIDTALPRLSEDRFIFRLRGGDPQIYRGDDINAESNLKKCLIIGAYFTAANWDWLQFIRSDRSDTHLAQIKFAMERYLMNVNHRLKSISAPLNLLREIDETKLKFEASDKQEIMDVKQVDQSLDRISKGLRAFMLTQSDYEMSFNLGKWLVWEAELSNLCLNLGEEYAAYLREAMNQSYLNVDFVQFTDLSNQIVGSPIVGHASNLAELLIKLNASFLVNSNGDVKLVGEQVKSIFDLFDLRFPSLKI